MKVLITGGTGLVGTELIKILRKNGHELAILTRNPDKVKGLKAFEWDYLTQKLDSEAIEFADAIIHLAGENIGGKRWSEAHKRRVVESRIQTTKLLGEGIKRAKAKPKTFIAASAIGYYGGITTEHIFTESDPPASDFLGSTVSELEHEVDQIEKLGLRVAKVRLGVVLSPTGGALEKMSQPVKMGAAAALGTGKQYIPWIGLHDAASQFHFILENEALSGVFNAVGPTHITNASFTKLLAKAYKKPYFLPNVPGFVLKLMLGEMAIIVLEGSRVSSEKIQSAGFTFKYQTVEEILNDYTS